DGPAIQLSSQRALAAGQTMAKTLDMVRRFRQTDDETPIILMGYYNPIYVYPGDKFLDDAKRAGVDGLIIVDLPPETDRELCLPARDKDINFIRLATPTTDKKRLPAVLQNASGFLYYVSIAGITGTAAPDPAIVLGQVADIKQSTDLPIAVGFGVKSRKQVAELAIGCDGVVVGSAIVNAIAGSLDEANKAQKETVALPLALVLELSRGIFDVMDGN
ncbi:MAG: tryptophan synthase subunit alpha, partial [Hyphomicrobiaceae bacterium]|nr:tryptophan synthase subunit alpha [Hyphomicrobiaceae bacterium]